MTTKKISLVTLAPTRQRLALRVVLARYIDEERAERNRAIEDGDQPNLWSARLDAFEVDPKALPDPFKAAFTAMFGDEKVQFDPDGVACEIWADRVDLWMGDGRAIRVWWDPECEKIVDGLIRKEEAAERRKRKRAFKQRLADRYEKDHVVSSPEH